MTTWLTASSIAVGIFATGSAGLILTAMFHKGFNGLFQLSATSKGIDVVVDRRPPC